MIVRDVYLDCFYYEESSLVYTIQHLLEDKKISLDDDLTKIDFQQSNQQKVAEMVQNNVLGIHKVHIYSLKMNKEEFVFIFAGSQEDAIQFYSETFHQHPLNCQEYPLDFQLARGKELISFRDNRKEIMSFPAIAGYFKKML